MKYIISREDFNHCKINNIHKPKVFKKKLLEKTYIHMCDKSERDIINVWEIQGYYETFDDITINQQITFKWLENHFKDKNKIRKENKHSTSYKRRRSHMVGIVATTVQGTYIGKWQSQQSAAKALGCHQSSISDALNKEKPFRGMVFKRIEK